MAVKRLVAGQLEAKELVYGYLACQLAPKRSFGGKAIHTQSTAVATPPNKDDH